MPSGFSGHHDFITVQYIHIINPFSNFKEIIEQIENDNPRSFQGTIQVGIGEETTSYSVIPQIGVKADPWESKDFDILAGEYAWLETFLKALGRTSIRCLLASESEPEATPHKYEITVDVLINSEKIKFSLSNIANLTILSMFDFWVGRGLKSKTKRPKTYSIREIRQNLSKITSSEELKGKNKVYNYFADALEELEGIPDSFVPSPISLFEINFTIEDIYREMENSIKSYVKEIISKEEAAQKDTLNSKFGFYAAIYVAANGFPIPIEVLKKLTKDTSPMWLYANIVEATINGDSENPVQDVIEAWKTLAQ